MIECQWNGLEDPSQRGVLSDLGQGFLDGWRTPTIEFFQEPQYYCCSQEIVISRRLVVIKSRYQRFETFLIVMVGNVGVELGNSAHVPRRERQNRVE